MPNSEIHKLVHIGKPGEGLRPGAIIRSQAPAAESPPCREAPTSFVEDNPHRNQLAGASTNFSVDLGLPFKYLLSIMRQLKRLGADKQNRRYFYVGVKWNLTMIKLVGLRVK